MQNNNDQNRRPDQQRNDQQRSNPGQQNQQNQHGQQPEQGLNQGLDTGAIQPGKTSQGDDANR